MSDVELMDERQAALILGLSPSTLEKLRRRNRGPKAVKIGRLVRYRRADLEAWTAGLPAWA
jgi:excisionase family DNA binding protein